ncbi:hypothetical protein Ais01nite_30960 [Asanoa ishikariensis]|uniref:GLTT repeat-containing protein n=1 Tax=Asanoa ishikariensis TaxID=137265 RepID=A0A1H3UUX9_9ACTN|nr:hypothetical protein [Asanoa ishikariensis]GIF65061.1 hypothetical protein Ais01nite_30960 [Asanoa ishikariensis]SDZ66066.1 hypothetical protein SAMN05421684_8093 [Asanoa ishikariensis]
MTKWIYRAVGTVGVAAGGALLLAGGAAQADAINSPANDLRGSLDGFFTPMGDVQSAAPADVAPGQHLGFLGAVPSDPAAGVDPAALEAGPAPAPISADSLTLLGFGGKKLGVNTVGDTVNSVGPLANNPTGSLGAGDLGADQLVNGQAQTGSALPVVGGSPLGESPLGALGSDPLGVGGSAGGVLDEDQLTGALGDSTDQTGRTLSDDNLNTIGSDSQMRTLGSTVDADQLSGFGPGALGGAGLDSIGRGGGLPDLGGGALGGGPLGELASDPLGAVGKHAAPEPNDFGVADLRGGDLGGLDGFGQGLVPPLIGEAMEAEMPPGFLGGVTEADDSVVGLPMVGNLPLSGVDTKNSPISDLQLLNSLGSFGGGAPAGGGGAQQPAAPAQAPAPARTQPAPSPTADDGGNTQRSHRQWSRSSSERPVDSEDADFR